MTSRLLAALPRPRDVIIGVGAAVLWLSVLHQAHSFGWYPTSMWAYRVAGVLVGAVLVLRTKLPTPTFLGIVLIYTISRLQAASAAEFLLFPVLLGAWTATAAGRWRWLVTLPLGLWAAVRLFWPLDLHSLVDYLTHLGSPQGDVWTYNFSRFALMAGMVVATVVLAALVGHQRELTAQLQARNAELERLRAVEAERVVAAERTRIARELHDIVAHHMSAVVLRAQAADRVADVDPTQPREAVRWIAATGQEALAAMRHVVRVLRAGTPDVALRPESGLAELPALAERMAAVGMTVTLPAEPVWDAVRLPLPVDLAAARIVQEALTNALVHGRATKAQVDVTLVGARLEITVDDDGTSVPPPPPGGAAPASGVGGGNGIAGMRERAASCSGDVDLGPSPLGGWRVHAWMRAEVGGAA